MARTSSQFNQVAVTSLAVCVIAGGIPSAILRNPVPGIAGAVVGVYLLFAIKVVHQWEEDARWNSHPAQLHRNADISW